MPNKTKFKCLNRTCKAPVNIPGRCEICAGVWDKTCAVARAARSLDEDEEDDMEFYYEPQEDFGADQGISVSDPYEYWE